MGLRDITLLIAIYGSIPFIFLKPFLGILVWYWLSLMNPHRISWTLANKSVAMIIGVTMLAAILISRNEQKKIPWTPITIVLALFWLWMFITTIFAFFPELAWKQWDKVWKIMLTTFVAIMVVNTKERILALVAVTVVSMGFWGVKGGIFTILSGGSYRVWGPPGSFISDNNHLALATIMTIPLFLFLRSVAKYKLVDLALLGGAILSAFAALGSQSRGALVGISSMLLFLAFKSRHRAQYILLIAIMAPLAWQFMPETWHERMGTIETFEEDRSAMNRITAWKMAFNLALHQPLGGGFETFKPMAYMMYLPEAGPRRTDAHSIWFEVMGEHGFIGFGLYVTLGMLAFFTCSRIIRQVKTIPEHQWMASLAAMIQVSIVAYAATGTFLGLAYFDYFYLLLALIVGMTTVLKTTSSAEVLASTGPRPAGNPVVHESPMPTAKQFAPTPKQLVQDLRAWYARL